MKRKLLAMNLVLAAAAAGLGWRLQEERAAANVRDRLAQSGGLRNASVPPPALLPPVTPVMPASYIDVAAKLLFSRDRNPTVVVDPPKPPPEPPMPPLPTAHGVMLWIDPPTVILSLKEGDPQKSYHPGDEVGPFKLVSVDHQNIVLEWHGKQVKTPLSELVSKNAPLPDLPSRPSAPQSNGVTSLSGPSAAGGSNGPGADMGGGARACVAGDTAPSGTVSNGYKKVEGTTPFGSSCHWEAVK